MIKEYLKIARFDHWIKQLFVIPGWFIAYILIKSKIDKQILIQLILAIISTSFIASANYVINEWLDAAFDKYHPIKKSRPVVNNNLNKKIIYFEYILLAALGLIISFFVSKNVLIFEIVLLIMGIIYNVQPLRTKEIAYIDVLSESINNALRFLIGWFAFTNIFYPPISIVFGYWMAGAFLMSIKRYAEYKMIGDKNTAILYRKSFKHYSEVSLLVYSFFFALLSMFFLGVFLVKYKVELVLFIPFMIGLYCYYLYLSFKEDSSVQKPEKLYKEKGLMIYLVLIVVIFFILLIIDLPILNSFTSMDLIPINYGFY